jgi:pyruvate,water dikinase
VRYEVAYPTVVERPEWLLRQLKVMAATPPDDELVARHALVRTNAEARLINTLGNSSASRRRLARARRVFPLREGNEAATAGIPLAGLRRLGLHLGIRLGLYRPDDVFDLTFDEVLAALRFPDDCEHPASQALERREEREHLAAKVPAAVVGEAAEGLPTGPPDLRGFPRAAAEQLAGLLWYTAQIDGPMPGPRGALHPEDHVLTGLGVSHGSYEGTARIIMDEDDFERIESGDVVVCPITSPVWSIVFPTVGALVCDAGGTMSHPAIIAREFAVPAVVGTGGATAAIPDGARVRVDGDAGRVTLLPD